MTPGPYRDSDLPPDDRVLETMAAAVLAHPPRRNQGAVVLIDGGSGAGKSVLAHFLRARLTRLGRGIVQLVTMDEMYPGWHGMSEASQRIVTEVLRATSPGYRRWDWLNNQPGDWVSLNPNLDLIVEGCGAITPESARLATSSVWIEASMTSRKERALRRDGADFAPWWDVWAVQEAEHWARHRPWELANVVLQNDELLVG